MPGRVLLEPGKRIGRFEIQQAIHSTEVSATYKAHDPDYERTVALKLVYESDPAAIESHLSAARVASKLDHENIAATHGGGQLPGGVLLVSEFYDGLALSTRLTRKEAFAWTEVLDIVRQIGAAIDYSRTRQAIHKRLHPGNIQVGWDGSIKILDFGSGPANHPSYTGWAYMAPEQIRGEEASSASNLFSLSVILYQIVVGQAPFSGDSIATLKEQILECKPQPPNSIKPNLPEGITNALLRGLAPNPSERYAMGLDLCTELERHRFWNPAVAIPTKPKGLPEELSKPLVIGVKPVQPSAQPSDSGTFAGGSGSYAAGTPVGQGATMRISAPQGGPALELMSPQETVYTGETVAAPAPAEQMPAQQAAIHAPSDQTTRIQPGGAAPGSSTKIRPQTGLPPLPPAARAGMQVDQFLHNMKQAASSPRKPFAWVFAFAAVILLAALIVAALVEMYPFHHKTEQAASDSSASNASNGSGTAVAPVTAVPATAAPNTAFPVTAPQIQQTEAQPAAQPVEEPRISVREAKQRKGKNKGKTQQVATAVAPALGTIMIAVTPADAQVFMDGAGLMAGGGARQVPPGKHTFVLSRPGYGNETRLALIAGGMQTNLSVRLNPLAAMVSLNTSPSGANIFIDGRDTGKLSPAEVTVSQGAHQIVLRKYGFLDSVQTANARMGEKAVITVTLQPTSTEPVRTVGGGIHKFFGGGVPSGMVRVKFVSSPEGAQIQINGQLLDKGTPVEAALKPGKYQVDIMADGYHTDHKVITVGNDKKMEVSSVLQRF